MTDARADAAALRAEFDEAFGRGTASAPGGTALLAIRIGTAPFAVRLLDAGGLVPAGTVVSVPSRRPDVLGVAGLRGELLPVYGLARMVLGADDAPPRWLLLAGGPERIGFAFTAFDGHLLAAPNELSPSSGAPSVARHVRELYTGDPSRPILDLASLVQAATARTDRENP